MRPDPLTAAFAERVASAGREPVLVAGRSRLFARELDRLAGAVAGRLPRWPEDAPIGLALADGPAFLAGLLAARRAGLPVVLLDARAPALQREAAARALGAAGVLGCAEAWPDGADDFAVTTLPGARPVEAGVDVIKLTSGTTGSPRGVGVGLEALLADEEQLASTMGLRDDERIACQIPMSHSYALSSVVLPALVRRSTILLGAGGGPLAWLETARSEAATFWPAVPAVLGALARMAEPPPLPGSLRLVISASAPLAPDTAVRFRERLGRSVHVFYGASECGGIAFDREGGAAERGTVGTPVEGVRVELREQEIVTVRSRAVAATYLPEPDARLGDGRFRTSDRAVWEGGELRLIGRVDDLINVRGRKVDPSSVEAVVADLEGVHESVALGVPSPDGQGEVVRLVVAARTGVNPEDVLARCRAGLADHAVPRSVILLPELPRTDRGKVDRQRLRLLGRDASS